MTGTLRFMLVVNGQAGDTGPLGRDGHEIFVVGNGPVRLELPDKPVQAPQFAAALEQGPRRQLQGRGRVQTLVLVARARILEALDPEFAADQAGAFLARHEQKFVAQSGQPPGQNQGPNRVAVLAPVHPI